MKILILRTFAHSRVWEKERNHCEFEESQLTYMINAWEPNYSDFKITDFRCALGIYTDKFFYYPSNRVIPITKEEQIISLLKLNSYRNTSNFTNINNDTLQVYYKFKGKLWNDPNIKLMNDIDEDLIIAKKNELEIKFGNVPYTKFKYPLSFSLDEDIVIQTLKKNGIDFNKEKI